MATPVHPRRLAIAAVLAVSLLLTACGSDSDGGLGDFDGASGGGGGGPKPPTPPSTRSFEEVKAATIEGWKACDMFADHVREFAEYLDYVKFDGELFSSNGANTAGVRICEGRAIYAEDPERAINNLKGPIAIGFGRADMSGSTLHDEKYRTKTGRYDLMMQLMRDIYEPDTLAERTEDGPWEEATVLLGDTGTGTTLSGFILDTERDFMLRLTMGGLDRGRHADTVSWDLEKAAKHFREVTMVNAYQAMADRYDEASEK